MASTNLLHFLEQVPDQRRAEGQRHDHTFVLLLILMSIMSGYIGYRAIGDFIMRNKDDLIKYFQPNKDRLPSFYTVRRIIQDLDFDSFSKQFYDWAHQYIDIKQGEWISLDGKAIKGTYEEFGQTGGQHFINLVSLYCSKQKMVLGNGLVVNSKESEIPVIQQLIQALDIQGVTFTLDALHCQKKRLKSLSMETMTT
jgi:hypothetical protein